jgi:hypothetical protein
LSELSANNSQNMDLKQFTLIVWKYLFGKQDIFNISLYILTMASRMSIFKTPKVTFLLLYFYYYFIY